MQLILASTSRYRQAILKRLQLPFVAVAPDFDEKSDPSKSPHEIAETFAREKCLSIADRFPEAVVLGCDQVVDLKGVTIGKPGTRERAVTQLQKLSGQTHVLHTAIFLRYQIQEASYCDETSLTMRNLSREEVEWYIDRDQPLDCAGGYKIESLGPHLLEKIQTHDPSAIEGLPSLALMRILRQWGFQPWRLP